MIFKKINTGVATTHLKSSRKPQLALLLLFLKTSDGGNKQQMLAEVALRRAEEIKHLTEASGFLFQQIKSILLKTEGRKEKHAQTMPEKTCLLSMAWKIIQGCCVSVKRQLKWCQGSWGLERPSAGSSFPVGTHACEKSCLLHPCSSPNFQEESWYWKPDGKNHESTAGIGELAHGPASGFW